jgi:hypothetical protein
LSAPFAAIVTLIMGVAAWSATAAAPAPMRTACASEIARYCQATPSSGGQLIDCLANHAASASAECRASALNTVVAHRTGWNVYTLRRVCVVDTFRLCPDLPLAPPDPQACGVKRDRFSPNCLSGRPAPRDTLACLRAKRDRLSPSCQYGIDVGLRLQRDSDALSAASTAAR